MVVLGLTVRVDLRRQQPEASQRLPAQVLQPDQAWLDPNIKPGWLQTPFDHLRVLVQTQPRLLQQSDLPRLLLSQELTHRYLRRQTIVARRPTCAAALRLWPVVSLRKILYNLRLPQDLPQ